MDTTYQNLNTKGYQPIDTSFLFSRGIRMKLEFIIK